MNDQEIVDTVTKEALAKLQVNPKLKGVTPEQRLIIFQAGIDAQNETNRHKAMKANRYIMG